MQLPMKYQALQEASWQLHHNDICLYDVLTMLLQGCEMPLGKMDRWYMCNLQAAAS